MKKSLNMFVKNYLVNTSKTYYSAFTLTPSTQLFGQETTVKLGLENICINTDVQKQMCREYYQITLTDLKAN